MRALSIFSQLYERLAPFVAAVVLAVSAAAVAVQWGIATEESDARARLASANRQIVERLDLVMDEFLALGREIEASKMPRCSNESLEQFRRVLFELKYLRDIGFVSQRTLLCSTAIGVIEQPQRSSEPDFVLTGGLQVYAFRPVRISAGQFTMVLQVGHYNGLVDPGFIANLSNTQPVRTVTVMGTRNGPRFPLHADRAEADISVSTVDCSPRYGFCIEAGSTEPRLSLVSSKSMGLGALGAGSGLAVFLLGHSMRLRSRNPLYRLKRAIARRDLSAVYQPIFSMPDGALVGVELLARWPSAPESLDSAEKFVAEAESNGLIHDLTIMMVDLAAGEIADWLIADPSRTLAVNISAYELAGDELAALLSHRFVDAGILSSQIVLELTERSVATPRRKQLDRLAAEGFQIYIDDLGEGYSSLSYLHHLPISGVKISRSFTSGLGTDSPKVDLVLAMIEVARKRNLTVVLEGIETRDQHLAMMGLGPLHCQGFHYARPMTAEELIALNKTPPFEA